MPTITLHGVYKIRAPEPCFIVEVTIHDSKAELAFSEVVYNVEIDGSDTEQAPFEEHFLSADGDEVLGDYTYAWDNPNVWVGEVRIAFLMHFLTPGGIIETPHGPLIVPEPTPRPDRLKTIKYVSPY